jgi:hypothetical protein
MNAEIHTIPAVRRTAPSMRAIVAEVAERYGYSADDLIAKSDCKRLGRVRRSAYLTIVRKRPELSQAQIATLFRRSQSRISRGITLAIEEEKTYAPYAHNEDHVFEVEAQLRRIAGTNLALQVGHFLSIPTWQAIFLSVLMEAYPDVKTADQICEAYDATSERLDHGSAKDGIQDASMKTFVTKIRIRFAEMGLEDPVARVRPRALILTDSAAIWLHCRFGKPVAAQVTQRMFG